MRGHGCSEHNRALDALLDKSACGAARGVERTVQVDAPELIDFLGCKVQRGLVLCAACVCDLGEKWSVLGLVQIVRKG